MPHVMVHLSTSTGLLDDDVWLVDSTPVECGRSRQTMQRSDIAGVGSSEDERGQLQRWVPRLKAAQEIIPRSRIMLECATGISNL